MESLTTTIKLLNIHVEICYQSEVMPNEVATKENLVIQLLSRIGAEKYVSGVGAAAYQKETAFAQAGIDLEYSKFRHPEYLQEHTEKFIPGLSCLDLLFNLGIREGSNLIKAQAS